MPAAIGCRMLRAGLRITLIGGVAVTSVNAEMAAADCNSAVRVNGSVIVVSVGDGNGMNVQEGLDCAARRQARLTDERVDIRLELRSALVRVTAPIAIPNEIMKSRRPVYITSAGSNRSTLSASVPLDGWSRIEENNTPRNGALWLYRVSVPREMARQMRSGLNRDHGQKVSQAPPELIVDGEVFSLARWPASGFLTVESPSVRGGTSFTFSGSLPAHADTGGVMAHGFWFHDWADAQRIVASIDARSATIALGGEPVRYGVRSGGRFVLLNSLAFISGPGQYVVPPDEDEIIFLPRTSPVSVELTGAVSVFRGQASNLKISNIDIEGASGSAVDLVGDNIEFDNVTVRNNGLVGIRLNGVNNTLRNVRVAHSGSIGVELIGGNRNTLQRSDSIVTESVIEDFGRLIWSANPGIRVVGVGMSVSHNLIRYGPHAGIFYFGNDHRIEGNEIYQIARLTDDVGAIYTGQDWTGRGNHVIGNYVHDLHGVGKHGATAFYLDDQASGVTVEDNIARNVDRGVLIGGGRDNLVRRNLFVNVRECIKADERGVNTQRPGTRVGEILRERLEAVPYATTPYRERYPGLATILSDHPGLPIGNVIAGNVGDCDSIIADSVALHGDVQPLGALLGRYRMEAKRHALFSAVALSNSQIQRAREKILDRTSPRGSRATAHAIPRR